MPGKFSLILMSDGGRTVRWRLGLTSLRVMVLVLLLLPVLAAGSLWVNWALYKERQTLLSENAALRLDTKKHGQIAARLANLERFLQRNDPDSLDKLAVARVPDAPGAPAPAASSGPAAAASPASPVSPAPSAGAAPVPAPAAPAPAAPVAPQAGAEPGAPPPAVAAEDPDAGEFPPPLLDNGLVRVDNIAARRVGARGLRISFDLYNTDQQPQVAGRAAFVLRLADGTDHPLEAAGDTFYRINRMKRIVGNPALPAGVASTDGASILVDIYCGDTVAYRFLAPLQP